MVFFDAAVTEKKWYALHIRCRHEKQVALRLRGKGVETFLPIRRLQQRWKDRKKLVDFPLFGGYVFIRIALTDTRAVCQTPGIVRIIGTKSPEAVPDHEIIAVKKFLEARIQYDPYPYLVPGMTVEVRRGPLKDIRGVLVMKKNRHRFVVNIGLINSSVATEIDADDVVPV